MKKILLYLLLVLGCVPAFADQTIIVGGALAPAHGGLPPGGTTGQVITKNSGSDYDSSWATISGSSSTTIATKITTITTSTTLTTANQTVLCNATAGNVTVTLPSPATACDVDVCSVFDVKKIDSTTNSCDVVVAGGSLIDGNALSSITSQYVSKTYQSSGTQYWHK